MLSIICAMDEESIHIVHEFNLSLSHRVWGMDIYSSQDKSIYLVSCGIGKTNASKATTYAITFLGATRIINIWVAWALNPTYNVGDAFIVSRVTPLDTFVPFDWYDYHTKSRLLNWPLTKYWYAKCGTSDEFIVNKSSLSNIPYVDIVDMELTSIAQVCEDFDIPLSAIKSVSDGANEDGLDFEKAIWLAMKNGVDLLKLII